MTDPITDEKLGEKTITDTEIAEVLGLGKFLLQANYVCSNCGHAYRGFGENEPCAPCGYWNAPLPTNKSVAKVVAGQSRIVARLEAAENETERLRDVLHRINEWCKAYPIEVFPEPDMDKANELLAAGGMSTGAIAAKAMRHVLEGVAKLSALSPHGEGR